MEPLTKQQMLVKSLVLMLAILPVQGQSSKTEATNSNAVEPLFDFLIYPNVSKTEGVSFFRARLSFTILRINATLPTCTYIEIRCLMKFSAHERHFAEMRDENVVGFNFKSYFKG